jgi:ABC-type antimicrobial peptide transport system permease subunit
LTPRIFADATGPVEREIVGVIADIKHDHLLRDAERGVFIPLAQYPEPGMRMVVRSARTLAALLPELNAVVSSLKPAMALFEPETMEEQMAGAVAQPRLNSNLVGAYAAIAVLLTGMGVYGVTAYSVAQRRREFGIRLALGASPRAVLRLVLRQSVQVLAVALPVGGLCALLAMRLLRRWVEGAESDHGFILPSVVLLIAGVALAACWLPARRAMRVDPMVELRCE